MIPRSACQVGRGINISRGHDMKRAIVIPLLFAFAVLLGGASPAIGARTVNMGPECGTIVVTATQRWTLKLFSSTFEGDYHWTFPGTGTLLISGIRAGGYSLPVLRPERERTGQRLRRRGVLGDSLRQGPHPPGPVPVRGDRHHAHPGDLVQRAGDVMRAHGPARKASSLMHHGGPSLPSDVTPVGCRGDDPRGDDRPDGLLVIECHE